MKEITNGHPPIGTGLPASKPNSPRDPRRRFASMWSGAVSVAPASVLPNRTDEFYKTEEEALFAIADALHEEYSAVVESGLLVQIDDAFLASYYDVMVPPPAWKITANGRHYGSMRSITPCVVSPRAMPLSRLLGKLEWTSHQQCPAEGYC
jgi:hypothetical protein